MKKKCLIILSTIFILSLMLPGLALANTETVIHEQFGSGYYATWQGDKGTWDRGKPGSSQTTKPQKYTIPKKKLENAELTRVEVETGYSFDPEVYTQAGGWQNYSYIDYEREVLSYAPDNLKATGTPNLKAGEVDVKWSMNLNPIIYSGERQARNTKDQEHRDFLKFMGGTYPEGQQGWLWMLPVHIKWYGIPGNLPDLYVDSLDPGTGTAKPGETYTVTVVFGLKDTYDEPIKNFATEAADMIGDPEEPGV